MYTHEPNPPQPQPWVYNALDESEPEMPVLRERAYSRKMKRREHHDKFKGVCMRPGCDMRIVAMQAELAAEQGGVPRDADRIWRTGPDGLQTLCKDCSRNYAKGKYVLWKHPRTKQVSIVQRPGWIRSRLIGFWQSKKVTNDLLRPEVCPINSDEEHTFQQTRRRKRRKTGLRGMRKRTLTRDELDRLEARQELENLDPFPIPENRDEREKLEQMIMRDLEREQWEDVGARADMAAEHMFSDTTETPRLRRRTERSGRDPAVMHTLKKKYGGSRFSKLLEMNVVAQMEPSSPTSSPERGVVTRRRAVGKRREESTSMAEKAPF